MQKLLLENIENALQVSVTQFIKAISAKYPDLKEKELFKIWEMADTSDEDVVDKLKEGCEYQYAKGDKQGQRCGVKSSTNSKYCSAHKKYENTTPKEKKILPQPILKNSMVKHPKLNVYYNEETMFVFSSPIQKEIISKIVKDKIVDLTEEDVEICKQRGLKISSKVKVGENDEESNEEQEVKKDSSSKKVSPKKEDSDDESEEDEKPTSLLKKKEVSKKDSPITQNNKKVSPKKEDSDDESEEDEKPTSLLKKKEVSKKVSPKKDSPKKEEDEKPTSLLKKKEVVKKVSPKKEDSDSDSDSDAEDKKSSPIKSSPKLLKEEISDTDSSEDEDEEEETLIKPVNSKKSSSLLNKKNKTQKDSVDEMDEKFKGLTTTDKIINKALGIEDEEDVILSDD